MKFNNSLIFSSLLSASDIWDYNGAYMELKWGLNEVIMGLTWSYMGLTWSYNMTLM